MTNCCSNSLCILLSNGISLPVLQVCVFFSAPAYVFGRIFFSFVCVCESQNSCCCCFQRKWDFVRAKKAQQQTHCFPHVKSVFTLIWRGCSIIHSLILSVSLSFTLPLFYACSLWIDEDEPFTIRSTCKPKKGTQKTADTRWNIWQSYATKHRSIHVHCTRVCVCLLRTFILTDRVKSKEDFNLSVYRCCYRNQSLCQIHTHTTRTKERRWPKKKSSRIEN